MKHLYICLTVVLLLTVPHPAQAGLSLLGGAGIPLVDFPIGNFTDVNKAGYGLQARYVKPVIPFLSLGPSIGYYRYNGKRIATGSAALSDFGFTVIPLMLTAQVKPPVPGIKPYANVSAGLYYMKVAAGSLVGTLPIIGPVNLSLPEISAANFGVSPGGGILVGLVPGVMSFEINASYHVIFTPLQKTTFLSILAGLNIGIL